MTDFTGKTAAVTGSSGIGLGAALLLARSGARVFPVSYTHLTLPTSYPV